MPENNRSFEKHCESRETDTIYPSETCIKDPNTKAPGFLKMQNQKLRAKIIILRRNFEPILLILVLDLRILALNLKILILILKSNFVVSSKGLIEYACRST